MSVERREIRPELPSKSRTMEGMLNFTTIILLIATATTIWYLLDYFYVPKHHPDEPPVVSHPIPYVGHIIGLLRHGTRYYEMTR